MLKGKDTDSQVRVLLFERDPATIKIVQNTMTELGYFMEPVMNVFSGLKNIKSDPPEVVIANFDFPDLAGLDLLKKMSELGYTVPVILYGVKSDENILNSFRSGAADYWMKPLLGDEMKERISHVVNTVPSGYDKIEFQSLMENLEREKKELKSLLKITSSLNVSGDTKISLNHLTDLAAEIMNCEAASIMLINESENVLEFVVASGEKKHKLETIKVPLGEGIAGWVAEHGKPQIVNDTKNDTRFTGLVDKQSGFETRQIIAVPMILDSDTIGVLEVINSMDYRDFNDDDLRVLNDMSERMATVIAATRKIEGQQNFFIQATNILVKSIEKKDIYAEGHSWKVAEYCHKIATEMRLPRNVKNKLHFGALLHDIGKLTMPSYIFNKRVLSDREKELIRQHPIQGAKLLESIMLWKSVAPCVLYHHESFDGGGYPFGRSGDSIPVCAKIINLTEAFGVMRSPNSYKKQMTLKETILEIMRMSGRQFDPEIVKIFIKILERENTPR